MTPASCGTSTRVSAAWRASPRARRACSTRRSSKRRAAQIERRLSAVVRRSPVPRGDLRACFPYPATRCALRAARRCAARLRLVDARNVRSTAICASSRPAEGLTSSAALARSHRARLRADARSSRRRVTLGDRSFAALPERTPAAGERRMTVGLLTGCVQRLVFPRVNDATVSVLAAEGCDVVAPAEQDAAARWRCTPAGWTRRGPSRGARSRCSSARASSGSRSTPPAADRR